MTYHLAIGNRGHSSWSLRAWLLFDRAGIEVQTHMIPLYSPDWQARMADFAPARTVPALRLPGGGVVWDTIAIAEEMASRHPAARFWPNDPADRALARSLMAEMHAGFTPLRRACPMNLFTTFEGFAPSPEVRADLDRLQALWAKAGQGRTGPWLFGDWSLADAFYAPVATRIATYGLEVDAVARAYVATWLADPGFRRWRAQGVAEAAELSQYHMDLPRHTWPGPAPRAARAVAGSEAENAACPYSGKPVSHVLEMDGRRWGFCNALCRDKTVADPEAWPAFMALVGGTHASG